MTGSHGKPYAGNLHVRFDEGADVPDEGRLANVERINRAVNKLSTIAKIAKYCNISA